jgi:hypothetical protein
MNKVAIFVAILVLSAACMVEIQAQGECSLFTKQNQCQEHQDCVWCAGRGHEAFCAPTGACPSPVPSHHVCNKTQYCCPDAKQCLTPTNRSCSSGEDSACSEGEVCCPLTKICVKPSGVPCKSTCDNNEEYCCPDALHCLTPTNPGVFCDPNDKNSCNGGDVCCPLTKICVKVGRPCVPAAAAVGDQLFFLRKK